MLLYPNIQYVYENIKRILDIDFPDLSSTKHYCSNCTKEARRNHSLKTCSRCRSVEYCCENCHRAHWKEHKRWCVAPEESAALIAAEYMNFATFSDDERERVVEAAEKAFALCRYNRVRTLTMMRVLRHFFLLVTMLHITVEDVVRVFGVPTASGGTITDIIALLVHDNGMETFLVKKHLQAHAIRRLRDTKCAFLRNALVHSKFYLQSAELSRMERVHWKYANSAADDFCRSTLVQWLELVTELSSVASAEMEAFFMEVITAEVTENSPFEAVMAWTDYVNYLWWELAWAVENTSESTVDGIVPPNLRDTTLIKDFNDGEDEAELDDPDYRRDDLPAMAELRTNFYEYFKNEVRMFRYHCVKNQCWEGPYTWVPAHMCDRATEDRELSEQVLVLGKRYKSTTPGELGRTDFLFVAAEPYQPA